MIALIKNNLNFLGKKITDVISNYNFYFTRKQIYEYMTRKTQNNLHN